MFTKETMRLLKPIAQHMPNSRSFYTDSWWKTNASRIQYVVEGDEEGEWRIDGIPINLALARIQQTEQRWFWYWRTSQEELIRQHEQQMLIFAWQAGRFFDQDTLGPNYGDFKEVALTAPGENKLPSRTQSQLKKFIKARYGANHVPPAYMGFKLLQFYAWQKRVKALGQESVFWFTPWFKISDTFKQTSSSAITVWGFTFRDLLQKLFAPVNPAIRFFRSLIGLQDARVRMLHYANQQKILHSLAITTADLVVDSTTAYANEAQLSLLSDFPSNPLLKELVHSTKRNKLLERIERRKGVLNNFLNNCDTFVIESHYFTGWTEIMLDFRSDVKQEVRKFLFFAALPYAGPLEQNPQIIELKQQTKQEFTLQPDEKKLTHVYSQFERELISFRCFIALTPADIRNEAARIRQKLHCLLQQYDVQSDKQFIQELFDWSSGKINQIVEGKEKLAAKTLPIIEKNVGPLETKDEPENKNDRQAVLTSLNKNISKIEFYFNLIWHNLKVKIPTYDKPEFAERPSTSPENDNEVLLLWQSALLEGEKEMLQTWLSAAIKICRQTITWAHPDRIQLTSWYKSDDADYGKLLKKLLDYPMRITELKDTVTPKPCAADQDEAESDSITRWISYYNDTFKDLFYQEWDVDVGMKQLMKFLIPQREERQQQPTQFAYGTFFRQLCHNAAINVQNDVHVANLNLPQLPLVDAPS